jgi:hypothetical protein
VNIVKTKCINDIVIIDGLARSGKFYLGKLVAGINGLEYFINSSEVERIIQINKAGILKSTDASALLLIAMNESIYNMAIGRNINMRHDDGSSVLNSFEKELYINRQSEGVAGEASIKQIINQERSSVFILHQSLKSVDMVKAAAPHSKIINIRRHPVDLVYSWIKKGWGHRFVNDPLSFDLVLQHNGNTVPYFAINWADEYIASNEYDRVVKSIVYLIEEESRVIEGKRHDICFVYYDNLIKQPDKEMSKICTFLNRSPHESMAEIIEKERREDISFQSQMKMKMDYINSGVIDKLSFDKLLELGNRYEKNINDGDA